MATSFLEKERQAAISPITWMEVMCGALDEAEEVALRSLLATFVLLPIQGAVAEMAVRIRRERRMKLPDAIIYATAQVHGLRLVTRNTKDFPKDWVDVVVPYELA
jgi:hypothetical protein